MYCYPRPGVLHPGFPNQHPAPAQSLLTNTDTRVGTTRSQKRLFTDAMPPTKLLNRNKLYCENRQNILITQRKL